MPMLQRWKPCYVQQIGLLLACAVWQTALADNWVAITGASNLQKLVAGATVEIELQPGVIAIGRYEADGSAEIKAWNESFHRTWSVQGEDQVCYQSIVDTNCYSFEQSGDNPLQFRARNTASNEYFVFRITGAEPPLFTSEGPTEGEGGLGAASASEIAAALSNPNSTLGSMNLQFDYIAYQGDIPGSKDADAQRITFQPSLPYPLDDTTNLFIRPAIPIIVKQDVPVSRGGFRSEGADFGDISFDASLGKTLPGGFVALGGLAATLPTASEDALGLDQWLLGPEAAIAMVRPWGVVGVLVSHQWDVAGEDDYDTSVTGGQYFYAFNLGGGWQINGSPTFSYNHEAMSDNKWTFPLAVGVSRTIILNGRPWKFGVQYWHYIETPDRFGPEYQLRFSISPVVKLPW